ncbi:MAG TPA: hypothetical protein PK141_20035 [Polyangiaceae bacterium]|nr:hypothetical protein [Polyangiaceae bacterium]
MINPTIEIRGTRAHRQRRLAGAPGAGSLARSGGLAETVVRLSLLAAVSVAMPACNSSEQPPSTAADASVGAILPLDPAGVHYGKSYAEWQTEWYRWFFGAPGSTHPILDATGVNCAVHQNAASPIFFLGGTTGGKASRKCRIPKGKALFFPILNAGADNGGVPAGEILTEAQLLATLKDPFKDATVAASIDGKDIPDLARYLVPVTRFNYTVPPGDSLYTVNGVAGVSGVIDPAFATGYYLLLAPLSPGVHQLKFLGKNVSSGQPFVTDVSYELSVD